MLPTQLPATRLISPPKKYRAFTYILHSGVNGFTENEILKYCRLSSGRNYATELERKLSIRLERQDELNTDGIGKHYRYRIQSKADALKVIKFVNCGATARHYQPINNESIKSILGLYSD